VTEPPEHTPTTPAGPADSDPADPGPGGREQAVAALFAEHHGPMVRLAALLGADDPEDIVAEAFYQVFRRWRRLRNPDRAVTYLRSVVCNLTRMRIRHLQVARRYLARTRADPTTTGAATDLTLHEGLHDDQRVLLEALTYLPARQREALVLRYWLDLREADIAAAMGISTGAVKSHTSRGIAALTRILDNGSDPAAHPKPSQVTATSGNPGQYIEKAETRMITRPGTTTPPQPAG
jgi:RNA polymerase sigma-70 factor (sigma-E family)